MSLIAGVAWFVAGAGLSLLHFATLARSVGRLRVSSARLSAVQTVSGYLGRYVSLLVGIVLALRTGAAAGMVFVLGYSLARWGGVWWFARIGVRSPDPA